MGNWQSIWDISAEYIQDNSAHPTGLSETRQNQTPVSKITNKAKHRTEHLSTVQVDDTKTIPSKKKSHYLRFACFLRHNKPLDKMNQWKLTFILSGSPTRWTLLCLLNWICLTNALWGDALKKMKEKNNIDTKKGWTNSSQDALNHSWRRACFSRLLLIILCTLQTMWKYPEQQVFL